MTVDLSVDIWYKIHMVKLMVFQCDIVLFSNLAQVSEV